MKKNTLMKLLVLLIFTQLFVPAEHLLFAGEDGDLAAKDNKDALGAGVAAGAGVESPQVKPGGGGLKAWFRGITAGAGTQQPKLQSDTQKKLGVVTTGVTAGAGVQQPYAQPKSQADAPNFGLSQTGVPVTGASAPKSTAVDQAVEMVERINTIGRRVETVDIQLAKCKQLEARHEEIENAEALAQAHIRQYTDKLGEASYNYKKNEEEWQEYVNNNAATDPAKPGYYSSRNNEILREIASLKSAIERESESMHSLRLAKEDLWRKLDEASDILEAITHGDPEGYKNLQEQTMNKISEQISPLYDKFTDEEKREYYRRLNFKEREIDEIISEDKLEKSQGKSGGFNRQELEKALEMMNAMPVIMGTTVTGAPVEVSPDEAASLFGQIMSEERSQEGEPTQEEGDQSIPGIVVESTSGSQDKKPALIAASQSRNKAKDEIVNLSKLDSQILGITVETEEIEHEDYLYDRLKNPDSATVIIKQGDKEKVVSGRAAVNLLIQQGEFYYLAGVGLVSKERRQAGKNMEVEYGKDLKKDMNTVIATTESCDEVVKYFDQECAKNGAEAAKNYCAKYNYSGCARDVGGCFSPYLPRHVFAGKACSDPRLMNCLKGAYGGFVGCVNGCNGQAVASGAGNLSKCLQACGETIKGQIEGCYGKEKK